MEVISSREDGRIEKKIVGGRVSGSIRLKGKNSRHLVKPTITNKKKLNRNKDRGSTKKKTTRARKTCLEVRKGDSPKDRRGSCGEGDRTSEAGMHVGRRVDPGVGSRKRKGSFYRKKEISDNTRKDVRCQRKTN